MYQIFDTTGKARMIEKARIAVHTIPNPRTGKEESIKCVEFTVIGKHHNWPSYMTLEEFDQRNPNVDKGDLGIGE
jgi:hypothetical protein